jgi:glycosyltransferase involved in cell wall biosynthesis
MVPTGGLLYSSFTLKGCRTSFSALNRVAEELPEFRLLCFGSEYPDFRLPLPRFARFEYRPPQAKLRTIYSQCDVWVCGSLVEGFHLPPLEAMACRCPVVSTRVGGPLDIVANGINGYLVDVNDEQGLADHVLRVLTLSGDEWKRMSDAAYRTATSYSLDDATTLFEHALQRAIERSRPMPRMPAML